MNSSEPKKNIVNIGSIKMGLLEPLILQSMTSTSTMDIDATVEQCIRIADAGAHLVRITARDTREAQALGQIKNELKKRGYNIPLSADIHFNPKAADVAAQLVEKVRINPGNYIDKKSGRTSWSKEEYHLELDKIKERLSGLVEICKTHKTAIRVGVNHGSLSERIINKYGNTAEGMAESAMEFIRIFKALDFNQLVISLKASNVLVMVKANELFKQKMEEENLSFPLHLGVTEAGDAEDGRIKSAVGIGCLLSQGIGETIRVSLTEEPEYEIPVAIEIAKASKENPWKHQDEQTSYARRKSVKVLNFGAQQVPAVIGNSDLKSDTILEADYYFEDDIWVSKDYNTHIQQLSLEQLKNDHFSKDQNYFLNLKASEWNTEFAKLVSPINHLILVLEKTDECDIADTHKAIHSINELRINLPIILKLRNHEKSENKLMIQSAVIAGPFFLKGQLDGLWIDSPNFNTNEISLGILQASRQRVSKTEYIACPSCGRTLFNIQEKLQDIKKKTTAFKGLKIAVMGCIVNGLGEMADADFGYVGAGRGKVNIYKKHDLIQKNVPEDEAADALLEIIEKSL
ncbi:MULTISPECIES: (E)-4-hydroxy-3-methylbut-2-enyl-diphosphate synthase [unclassified Lentimicrobium]|uniref:(E)-4-hydroxy-3-methylbut-2-enyl-diphosphate synthase n=1 Tax=unclassified Lentimicrobium TaxID=2677434 RepID=UPI0015520C14|nr:MULTISPECIES: (E)-4-hydroxy-3-methylbut-2-enyl-diphosphate synthase [unclassified Lentimicrobium]NPD44450.1 (E)-4-hydroxy-3-methylbut-2-enyl-diphosphate synthase [Lentimicrobium sp. S6]NPD83362.1 (E)-4-hydroxy-3-methylbut-2-enyl-diphosphate synthase [Lentimicrobium sp. L6]